MTAAKQKAQDSRQDQKKISKGFYINICFKIVIKKGPKPIPGLTDKDGTEKPFNLESFDITKEQQEVIQTNVRAISLLYCAVSGAEYDKISTCETAKEMWDKLEVTYEGTTKVKEAQISSLVNEYKLFKMAEDENVETMFSRFSKIVCELKSFGMVYSNELQVRKLVKSLLKAWETTAAIL
ncbi:uncharacterized protein LOC125859121 [Solanum stenotomum]|uniref:uncharacterized protein LOC125859121 n=1 Tax=Solanum stenotomum TaxID=172797 RepID=UPI0020D06B84|nr:uncharacterized protein LOC125859121 [Solanum stenotomum]